MDTRVFLEGQHTLSRTHTHTGDFVSSLAQSDFPVQHVSTLTNTVWSLCVWLQHCVDTCMQLIVTLDCIHRREMVVDNPHSLGKKKRKTSSCSETGVTPCFGALDCSWNKINKMHWNSFKCRLYWETTNTIQVFRVFCEKKRRQPY